LDFQCDNWDDKLLGDMDDYKKEFERKWGLPWEETFENPKLA